MEEEHRNGVNLLREESAEMNSLDASRAWDIGREMWKGVYFGLLLSPVSLSVEKPTFLQFGCVPIEGFPLSSGLNQPFMSETVSPVFLQTFVR
jgi:hypothetical protein